MNYSLYYQAHIKKEMVWLATATFRFTEHVIFDRTIDTKESIFEFFVAPDLENVFLDMMQKLQKKNIVCNVQKMKNRFMEDV